MPEFKPIIKTTDIGIPISNGQLIFDIIDKQIKLDYSDERKIFSEGGYFLNEPFITATAKRKITIKGGTRIKLGEDVFYPKQDIELNIPDILDTGSISNGKDYYLHLIRGGANLDVKASLNKDAPTGLNQANAKRMGGLHTLCADAGANMTYTEGGEIKAHPLNGYVASDILPHSVWCLNHLPYSEPEGTVYIPSLDFWCDIYLQSGSGKNTKSAYQGAITRNRQYVDFVEDLICVKKSLLSDEEFAAAMMGSNEQTSVGAGQGAGLPGGTNAAGTDGAATGNGAGGRKDSANRRMISIYGVEEGCGSLWQYLASTSAAGYEGSMYGQTSQNGVTPITYGQLWSKSGKTLSDAAGNNLNVNSSAPQSGGKGFFYYMCAVLGAGGDWNDGAICGSRARDAPGARSHASPTYGGRGRSLPRRVLAY